MNSLFKRSLNAEDSVKMAAASEDESAQMSVHDVTSCEPVKPEDGQRQAPVSSVSGGRLVDENPFLIWFHKEVTESARGTV